MGNQQPNQSSDKNIKSEVKTIDDSMIYSSDKKKVKAEDFTLLKLI